jgi:glucose/arabinose dehydrogenase
MLGIFNTAPLALALVLLDCGGGGGGQPGPSPSPSQSGAPTPTPTTTAVAQRTIATNFDNPWAMVFLPDGRLLVTEKPGKLQLVTTAGAKTEVAGVPAVT